MDGQTEHRPPSPPLWTLHQMYTYTSSKGEESAKWQDANPCRAPDKHFDKDVTTDKNVGGT